MKGPHKCQPHPCVGGGEAKAETKNECYSCKKGHFLLPILMMSWQKGLTRAGPFLSGPWKEDRGEGVRRHMLEQLHMELCCTQLIAAVTGN